MTRPLFHRRTTKGAAEFYLRYPENLLLVKKERDGGVIVCAMADNLSVEQQAAFVRYLQAEGFTFGVLAPPDWFYDRTADQEGLPVRWVVDPFWPEVDPVYARHLQRLCWYTAGAMMVWLALVAVLICF